MEEERETLNIFDFDGTLFKSPVPNPEKWDSRLLGKFRSTVDEQGLGWFQDVLTLSEPYVPSNPGDDWFVPHVKEAVMESMIDDKCATVLLTGRTMAYKPLILKFLESAGLVFDELGLKPQRDEEVIATMKFKERFIHYLIKKYRPNIVKIWEDREDHVAKFKKFFSEHYSHLNTTVVPVLPSRETFLPWDLELDIITKLKEKHNPPYDWEEQTTYTCVLLEEESVNTLKSYFEPISGWTEYYHHMTICLGSLASQQRHDLPPPSVIGETVELIVCGVGRDDRAFAVQVTGYPSINAVPHITLCVAPGAQPKHSNEIRNWKPIPPANSISLFGSVIEMKRYLLKTLPKTKPDTGLNLGKLVVENTSFKGKEVSAAMKKVTDWMTTNQIENKVSSTDVVVDYIKSLNK